MAIYYDLGRWDKFTYYFFVRLKKITKQLESFFLQGLTPEQLSISISLGVILGVFPMVYIPSLLVMACCALFRLNVSLMMMVNWLVYPLQIILFVPFVQVGSLIIHSPLTINNLHFNFSWTAIQSLLSNGVLFFVQAIVGWFICALPSFVLLRTVFLVSFRLYQKVQQARISVKH